MAFDLTGLADYVNENSFPILAKSVTAGRTASMMEKQLGIQGETKMSILNTDVNFQDNSGCTFVNDGNVTITQRTINPGQIKINLELCPNDLKAKWLSQQLPAGAHQESIPFEEFFVNNLIAKVQEQVELAIWQSDSSLVSGNLQFFDGLRLATASGTVDANSATIGFGAALTSMNIEDMVEAIQRLYTAAPSSVIDKDDAKIFLGYDRFRLLVAALQAGNGATTAGQLASYQTDYDPLRFVFPGTGIEVVAVNGLTGFENGYLMRTSNMYLGTSLDEDFSNVEMWYSKDQRKLRFVMEFTLGANVAFLDEVAQIRI